MFIRTSCSTCRAGGASPKLRLGKGPAGGSRQPDSLPRCDVDTVEDAGGLPEKRCRLPVERKNIVGQCDGDRTEVSLGRSDASEVLELLYEPVEGAIDRSPRAVKAE